MELSPGDVQVPLADELEPKLGFSASVFFCNLFMLPSTVAEFLDLPHETYDTAEELADANWRVD